METQKSDFNNLSKKKRRIFKLMLVAFGLVFGLTIAEIGLRIAGYSFPEFYAIDERLGYALAPDVAGWYRKEGRSFVRINADGLRDDEHAVEKPENTIRIAVVGDSYAEALQVPLENAFWRVMQPKLNRCGAFGNRQIEVINFGVSGYGTAQELILIREKIWKYAPDIVILAVTTNNDVTDNSRHFKKIPIPYFVFSGDALTLDDSFRSDNNFRWRNSFLSRAGAAIYQNLRVAQAINEAQMNLKARYKNWKNKSATTALTADAPPPQNFQQVNAAPQTLGDVGIDNQIYRVPADENWRAAWRVTEELLILIKAEVEAKNARLFVVTLSNGIQVYPDSTARTQFMRRVGSDDLLYPDKRIKNFGDAHDIKVFNLAPDLQRYAEQNQIFLHGFNQDIGNGHWNETGHRVAGELLGDRICGAIGN